MKKMKFLLTAIVVVSISNLVFAQWSLTGNSGTTPGTNFLGTTDAKDLVFETNTIERMRIFNQGGISIGNSNNFATTTVPLSLIYSISPFGTNTYSKMVEMKYQPPATYGTGISFLDGTGGGISGGFSLISTYSLNASKTNYFTVTSNGSTVIGANNTTIGVDQGGNIELGGNNSTAAITGATPYLDFHYGTGSVQDYNVRLTNSANGVLELDGGVLKIGSSITTPAGYNLYVANGILTEKAKVAISTTSNWSDYVFDKDYQLSSLSEVEKYIKKNKHLPDIPSAAEVVKDGVDLGAMDAKLLQKIEELTLYMIEMKKENEKLKERMLLLEAK